MQCVIFPSPVHSLSCNDKPIDCSTIKGKLTARKPWQATALGGELLLSSESSKSQMSDVFLLFCRSVRSVRVLILHSSRITRVYRSSILFLHTLFKRQLNCRFVLYWQRHHLAPAYASNMLASIIYDHSMTYFVYISL